MALYEAPQKTGELMKMVASEPWLIVLMVKVRLSTRMLASTVPAFSLWLHGLFK